VSQFDQIATLRNQVDSLTHKWVVETHFCVSEST